MRDVEDELEAGLLRAITYYGKSESIFRIHMTFAISYVFFGIIMLLCVTQGITPLLLGSAVVAVLITTHIILVSRIKRW